MYDSFWLTMAKEQEITYDPEFSGTANDRRQAEFAELLEKYRCIAEREAFTILKNK